MRNMSDRFNLWNELKKRHLVGPGSAAEAPPKKKRVTPTDPAEMPPKEYEQWRAEGGGR